MKQKTKNEKNNNDDDSLLYLYKKHSHPRERMKRRTKKTNDKVTKASKYLLGRVKQVTKKL